MQLGHRVIGTYANLASFVRTTWLCGRVIGRDHIEVRRDLPVAIILAQRIGVSPIHPSIRWVGHQNTVIGIVAPPSGMAELA